MVGRKKEVKELNNLCESKASSLVAIYGRRRIGKTYLVNYMFKEHRKECLFFEFTGASDSRFEVQLKNFIEQVYEWFRVEPVKEIEDWTDAFIFLKRTIDAEVEKRDHKEKVIIFIDELPWVDPSEKKGFLSALGYFWNTYCESSKNVLMILCGSNASWIKNKVLEDAEGPLHNRITKKLPMFPFDLQETKEYLTKERNFDIGEKLATDLYMIFGGVAKYLSYLDPNKSINDNIDSLFFTVDGLMYNEYDKVFNSLFVDKRSPHRKVVDLICQKRSGYTQVEISKELGETGGKLNPVIEELLQCGFIQGTTKYGFKSRDTKYVISDPYVLFHHKWIKELSKNDISKFSSGYWRSQIQTQTYAIWRGFSFESVIISNMNLYLKARGMSGTTAKYGYWNTDAKASGEIGAQIDMVVDYGNSQYDIVECKYYKDLFEISKKYKEELENKLLMFRRYGLRNKKSAELRLVFVTSEGVKANSHYHSLNIESIEIEDLIS